MLPCGSALGGVSGAASGVDSGVLALRGGVTCGAVALLKISVSCLRDDDFLSPNAVSVLVGVGLRKAWVRSAAACVAA